MSWAIYPDYVESGVPWLGALPSHWTTPHLAHIVECLDAVRIPLNATERAEVPGNVPYWGANGVVGSVARPLVDGELVLLGEDGAPFTDRIKEKAFYVNQPIWPNNHIHVLRPSARILPQFLTHALNATEYSWFIEGSTREKLTQGKMLSIPIAMPPFVEQRLITAFLERETAKIDVLIEKQEQLIATLREDRAATITQVVTKGLDPNTKMKASGVQWISEIPATWNLLRLSWMFATISSGTTPDSKNLNYYGGEVNWVTTGELREGYVEKTTSRVTDLALADHSALRIYEPGSLVIAMYGATIGRLGILSAPACTNQACCVFSKPEQTDVRFIYYVLQAAREHLLVLASGGGQPNINQDKLRALRVPAPNLETQRKISEYLDERCSKIDALIVKSSETIKVLREYRSALITNAVTGKIDVREAV